MKDWESKEGVWGRDVPSPTEGRYCNFATTPSTGPKHFMPVIF